MVFKLLGRVVGRAWPLLLAAWGVLLLGTWLAAPRWDDFVQDKEFAFLPADAPSRRAAGVYAQAFPDAQSASNIVIVLHRPENGGGHLEQDLEFIEDVLEPGLR